MRRLAGRDNITTFPRFPPPPCAALERPTRCTLTSLPNASHMRLAWGACTDMRLLTSPGRTRPATPEASPGASGGGTPAPLFFGKPFSRCVVKSTCYLPEQEDRLVKAAHPLSRGATETQETRDSTQIEGPPCRQAWGGPSSFGRFEKSVHHAAPAQGVVRCFTRSGAIAWLLRESETTGRCRRDPRGACTPPAPGRHRTG